MLRAIIAGIFTFLVFGIISVTIWYKSIDESLGSLHLKRNIIEPRTLSIKEIDDISALTNFHFTIQNKIIHRGI